MTKTKKHVDDGDGDEVLSSVVFITDTEMSQCRQSGAPKESEREGNVKILLDRNSFEDS